MTPESDECEVFSEFFVKFQSGVFMKKKMIIDMKSVQVAEAKTE